ncbi:hypothetical protein C2845_PM03G00700 [Panicum miliaceum]|uniref:Uncharacterized protein n=1 Tax=Panicum miliaceum TaxID=4540 RepID=A0A3L6T7W8_PANMI|nr:hypothetical protein C2845_PM03G00700 [Panicum miliaceum]
MAALPLIHPGGPAHPALATRETDTTAACGPVPPETTYRYKRPARLFPPSISTRAPVRAWTLGAAATPGALRASGRCREHAITSATGCLRYGTERARQAGRPRAEPREARARARARGRHGHAPTTRARAPAVSSLGVRAAATGT